MYGATEVATYMTNQNKFTLDRLRPCFCSTKFVQNFNKNAIFDFTKILQIPRKNTFHYFVSTTFLTLTEKIY